MSFNADDFEVRIELISNLDFDISCFGLDEKNINQYSFETATYYGIKKVKKRYSP